MWAGASKIFALGFDGSEVAYIAIIIILGWICEAFAGRTGAVCDCGDYRYGRGLRTTGVHQIPPKSTTCRGVVRTTRRVYRIAFEHAFVRGAIRRTHDSTRFPGERGFIHTVAEKLLGEVQRNRYPADSRIAFA